MDKRVLHILLNMAGAGLGIAGLILILLSIFMETDTLRWGMLCVASGSILALVRMLWNKKSIVTGISFRAFAAAENRNPSSGCQVSNKEDTPSTFPIGMCIGIAIGTAIGAATNNIGTWLPIGLCIGLSLGFVPGDKNKDKHKDDTSDKQ